jgi:hypothetical protein
MDVLNSHGVLSLSLFVDCSIDCSGLGVNRLKPIVGKPHAVIILSHILFLIVGHLDWQPGKMHAA